MAKKPTLGSLIDQAAELKEKITQQTKIVDDLKRQRVEVENAILESLSAQEIESSSGTEYTASKVNDTVYNISDYDALTQFIVENNAPYVFQRRLSSTAIRDLLSEREGEMIPGLEPVNLVKLSFRKRPK